MFAVVLAGGERAWADPPPAAVLDELRQRLLAAPSCAPRCAEIVDADVVVEEDEMTVRLVVHAVEDVAVPMPGSAQGWRPQRINAGQADMAAHRDSDGVLRVRLDAGRHELALQGSLPPGDTVEIPFPATPRSIAARSDHWFVAGVRNRTLVADALNLTRLQATGLQETGVSGRLSGIPSNSTCQALPMSNFQTSRHGWSVGAVNVIDSRGAGWRVAVFHPRPGETLNVTVSRPEAVAGGTLAFDHVAVHTAVGAHQRRSVMDVHYRSTQGTSHRLRLPPAADFESVTIDGDSEPVVAVDGELTVPILPGEHTLSVAWNETAEPGFRLRTPEVELGTSSSNVVSAMTIPSNRWLMFTTGPTLGPAVLYWPELIALILASLIDLPVGSLPIRCS